MCRRLVQTSENPDDADLSIPIERRMISDRSECLCYASKQEVLKKTGRDIGNRSSTPTNRAALYIKSQKEIPPELSFRAKRAHYNYAESESYLLPDTEDLNRSNSMVRDSFRRRLVSQRHNLANRHLEFEMVIESKKPR
ncbi:hypothetical protein ACOME3_001491 [Neoechinorhynchus agilis]